LPVSLETKNAGAPAVKLGSTFQDVIRYMGTPDSLTADSTSGKPYILEYKFSYGKMVFGLNQRTQIVEGWTKLDTNNRLIESSRS
jgi:hypothetical protein